MNAVQFLPHGCFLLEVEHAEFPSPAVTSGGLRFGEKSFPVVDAALLGKPFCLIGRTEKFEQFFSQMFEKLSG